MLLSLAACASDRTAHLRDNGGIMPTLRGEFDLGEVGVSAELSRAFGEPSATADYELTSLQVLARLRVHDGHNTWAHALGGLEVLDVEVRESAGANSIADSEGSFGIALGGEAGCRLFGPVASYARTTVSGMIPLLSSVRSEFGVLVEVADHADVFVAWRGWHVEYEDVTLLTNETDVDLRIEGVVFGASIRF